MPKLEDLELEHLRKSVDYIEKRLGKQEVNNENIQKIIKIVEKFLISKKLICYGGTAINNILPESEQFYDKSAELPDYDFFSTNALNDAEELAGIR